MPCQAFYCGTPADLQGPISSWKLYSETPIPVKFQGDYQTTARSQVLCDPLLILSFVLSSIEPVGNPLRVICEIMHGFLGDSLLFEELPFDLSSEDLVEKHEQVMNRLVRQFARWVNSTPPNSHSHFLLLYRTDFARVVVFVMNHSHDDTGDLYIGPNHSATVESVCLCITSWYSLISSSFFFNFFPSCSSWRHYSLSAWSLSLKRDLPHCLCWLAALLSKTRQVTQIWPNPLPHECCIFFDLFISWCFCFSYPKYWHWRPRCFYGPRIPCWLDCILLCWLYPPRSCRRL